MNNFKAFIFLFIIFLMIILIIAKAAYKEAEIIEVQIEKMNYSGR
jgi:hypothetical protein